MSVFNRPAPYISMEEIQRRIAEYKFGGYQKKASPHVVYPSAFALCPWPDCSYRSQGIDFQIEQSHDLSFYNQVMAAWWRGVGIVAKCPECQRYVLFSLTEKKCVENDLVNYVVLPDNWHENALIIP